MQRHGRGCADYFVIEVVSLLRIGRIDGCKDYVGKRHIAMLDKMYRYRTGAHQLAIERDPKHPLER
ncbi:hypothetical protein D3C76_1338100 [compost metagenome]